MWQLQRAGGPQMHTIHAFSFVREMWSELRCTSGLPSWTFAHAVVDCDWFCARPAPPDSAWPDWISARPSVNVLAGRDMVVDGLCLGDALQSWELAMLPWHRGQRGLMRCVGWRHLYGIELAHCADACGSRDGEGGDLEVWRPRLIDTCTLLGVWAPERCSRFPAMRGFLLSNGSMPSAGVHGTSAGMCCWLLAPSSQSRRDHNKA